MMDRPMLECHWCILKYLIGIFQIVSSGQLRVLFNAQGKIELWEFTVEENAELLERRALTQILEKQRVKTEISEQSILPESPVNEFAIPLQAMRCLEVLSYIRFLQMEQVFFDRIFLLVNGATDFYLFIFLLDI